MARITIKRGDQIIEVSDLSLAEVKELIGVNGYRQGQDSPVNSATRHRRRPASSGEPDFRGFYDSLSEKGKTFLGIVHSVGSKGIEAKDLAEMLGFKSGNQIGGLTGGGLGKQAPKFHVNLDDIYTTEVKFENGVRQRIFKPGSALDRILN